MWKIADFGLTVKQITGRVLRTEESRGTPGWRAPELLSLKTEDTYVAFDEKVDIWAAGCILFLLLFRYEPFANDEEVRRYGKSKTLPFDACEEIESEERRLSVSQVINDTIRV